MKNPQLWSLSQWLQLTLDVPWYASFLKCLYFFTKVSYLQHIRSILLKWFSEESYLITPGNCTDGKFWNEKCPFPFTFIKSTSLKYVRWISEKFQMSGKVGTPNRTEGVENFWSASSKTIYLKNQHKIRPWSYVNSKSRVLTITTWGPQPHNSSFYMQSLSNFFFFLVAQATEQTLTGCGRSRVHAKEHA